MAGNARWTLIKINLVKMYNNNITVERLEQIEQERQQTMADLAYQRWMQELKVASMYVDQTLIWNARQAMQEWDSSRFNTNRITEGCME